MKLRTLRLACSGIALSLVASAQTLAQAQTDIPVAQQTQTGPAAAPRRAVRTNTPPPRDANGRAVLGSVPGNVGSWEGFGSRPMLRFLDVEYEGNIMAFTPLEQALNDPANFPKIRESEIPYQPWAKALFEARARTRFEPYVRCKPAPGPRTVATAYGTQFVEFPEDQKIYIFPTGGPRHHRVIYMDGRGHPDNLTPTYHGHSIGHWEGDTLVVDSVGFNEKMWLDSDGSPHTEQLHLIEKITRVSMERLKYEVTIDDPGAYTATWSSGFFMDWTPGESFQFVCQDANLAFDLMLGNGEDYQTMDRSQPIYP